LKEDFFLNSNKKAFIIIIRKGLKQSTSGTPSSTVEKVQMEYGVPLVLCFNPFLIIINVFLLLFKKKITSFKFKDFSAIHSGNYQLPDVLVGKTASNIAELNIRKVVN
jgi:hypothetical protein